MQNWTQTRTCENNVRSTPRGAGRIRLVRIGDVSEQVDLQPVGHPCCQNR